MEMKEIINEIYKKLLVRHNSKTGLEFLRDEIAGVQYDIEYHLKVLDKNKQQKKALIAWAKHKEAEES